MRSIVFAISLTFTGLLTCPDAQGEPTTASETAAKKLEADQKLDEQYQALVKTLSPAEQAWERVLQENLGSF